MNDANDDAAAAVTRWPETPLQGTLHIFRAFDWGEEVDLVAAAKLVPCEPQELPRRRRTPSSIAYHPVPLRFRLPPVDVQLGGLGPASAAAEVILFDFAAVSVASVTPPACPTRTRSCRQRGQRSSHSFGGCHPRSCALA